MRALKICLWIAGVLWLLSLIGVFLPISAWESVGKFFGAEPLGLVDSPLFVYMIRVGLAMAAAIGVYLIILALNPMKYPVLVPFTGLAGIFIGIVCGITGLLTAMPALWFLGDSLSCFIGGVLILIFWQKAKKTPKTSV